MLQSIPTEESIDDKVVCGSSFGSGTRNTLPSMVRILSIVGDAAASVVMEGASRKLLISNKMMFVIVHQLFSLQLKREN